MWQVTPSQVVQFPVKSLDFGTSRVFCFLSEDNSFKAQCDGQSRSRIISGTITFPEWSNRTDAASRRVSAVFQNVGPGSASNL